MIFLFFGSSLGPLEPELAPFKDLEEIGDIWEISFKVVQCSAVQLGHQAGADATLREMSQMSQISCQPLNRANSGSRGPREDPKKRKIIYIQYPRRWAHNKYYSVILPI